MFDKRILININPQHIFIGILILICLVMGWGLGNSCNKQVDYNEKILQYRDSLNRSKGRVKELELQQKSLEKEISDKYKEIQKQKIQINKLKKKLNEKVDSVRNLDNEQSLQYITKWLSERDNLKK